MSKRKEYGIVYTPEWVADFILDETLRGYTAGMQVCDPACGDGAFLTRLVSRICDTVPARRCRAALQNITGFDIDAAALSAAARRLDETLTAKGKRLKINWNLHCIDSTDRAALAAHAGRFDFVVGNPPYVRIQHLGARRRQSLQQNWQLARRGSTDLYIAFFEIGMFLLKPGGHLGYITPNTFAKSAAGAALRRFILAHHGIRRLVDFSSHQVFAGATTYSLISVLQKERQRKHFKLSHYDGRNIVDKGTVAVSHLSDKRLWTLQPRRTLARLAKIRMRGRPLAEIADIHVGLQTLADDVFIVEKTGAHGDMLRAVTARGKPVQLEAAITRPILKASVMQNGRDRKERVIIFPYRDGKLLAEEELRGQFPAAYRHLTAHKQQLLARDKGGTNAARWYAFGREFGLRSTFGDKLLTSGMNKRPNFQRCPAPQYTFYAGYCVKPKAGVDADALLAELNSAEMEFYIRHTSRDYQNGWKSYAKSFIGEYGVPADIAGEAVAEPARQGCLLG